MNKGIYDGWTMEEYLSADAVSASMLRLLGTRSPAHLKAQMDGEKRKETKALRVGSLIDTAVFEPDKLESSVHIKPATCLTAKKCRVPWDAKTNDAQEWLEGHRDKPVVSQAELDTARSVADSVRAHPAAQAALARGKAQQTLIVPAFELFGAPSGNVMVRCRPDWMTGNVIPDLKSTLCASKDEFSKSIYSYGYDVQSALYLDAANALGLKKEVFMYICVEKDPPYAVGCYRLDEESVDKGRAKYRYWLAQYCDCVLNDEWPGYRPGSRRSG